VNLWDIHVRPEDKILLAFGNEEYGLKQSVLDKCDKVVTIPMLGVKNSLNIASASAVVFYEITKSLLR
jgi:tRNA G18 (ribose-2'-O)-methylase SpoU